MFAPSLLSLSPSHRREDIIDENWSIRDSLKEWKLHLDATLSAGSVSDAFYLTQITDFERLASTQVRLLRPLLNTIAKLGGDHHIELTHAQPSSASSRGAYTSSQQQLSQQEDLSITGARARFLQDVQATLRVMHRNIARQFDQASLSVNLAKGLLEQYTQRGRDMSNDRLYLLTVVTTIVMPLQIATGVYGMNFVNIPELVDENGYYVSAHERELSASSHGPPSRLTLPPFLLSSSSSSSSLVSTSGSRTASCSS